MGPAGRGAPCLRAMMLCPAEIDLSSGYSLQALFTAGTAFAVAGIASAGLAVTVRALADYTAAVCFCRSRRGHRATGASGELGATAAAAGAVALLAATRGPIAIKTAADFAAATGCFRERRCLALHSPGIRHNQRHNEQRQNRKAFHDMNLYRGGEKRKRRSGAVFNSTTGRGGPRDAALIERGGRAADRQPATQQDRHRMLAAPKKPSIRS